MFLKLKKPQQLALPKFQLELGVAFYDTEMLVINNKHSYIYHFPDTYLTASSWLNNILQTVLYHATNVFLLNANFNFFMKHLLYIHFTFIFTRLCSWLYFVRQSSIKWFIKDIVQKLYTSTEHWMNIWTYCKHEWPLPSKQRTLGTQNTNYWRTVVNTWWYRCLFSHSDTPVLITPDHWSLFGHHGCCHIIHSEYCCSIAQKQETSKHKVFPQKIHKILTEKNTSS